MSPASTIQPYLPVRESYTDPKTGILTPVGFAWCQQQGANIGSIAAAVNVLPGVNTFTVGTQPALGVGDAGYLGWLSDYQLAVRWTGATWQFFGGSDNNFFSVRPAAPQGGLWALCDGSATTYLTLGATLSETNFTTPDLVSTSAYFKSIAAYTGTVNAKAGSTAAGSTSTGTTGGGSTSSSTSGSSTDTFTTGTNSANATADEKIPPDATATLAAQAHTHSGTTDGHTHSIPSLAVAGLSIPSLTVGALGVGTIEMANLGVLVWFRR